MRCELGHVNNIVGLVSKNTAPLVACRAASAASDWRASRLPGCAMLGLLGRKKRIPHPRIHGNPQFRPRKSRQPCLQWEHLLTGRSLSMFLRDSENELIIGSLLARSPKSSLGTSFDSITGLHLRAIPNRGPQPFARDHIL